MDLLLPRYENKFSKLWALILLSNCFGGHVDNMSSFRENTLSSKRMIPLPCR